MFQHSFLLCCLFCHMLNRKCHPSWMASLLQQFAAVAIRCLYIFQQRERLHVCLQLMCNSNRIFQHCHHLFPYFVGFFWCFSISFCHTITTDVVSVAKEVTYCNVWFVHYLLLCPNSYIEGYLTFFSRHLFR